MAGRYIRDNPQPGEYFQTYRGSSIWRLVHPVEDLPGGLYWLAVCVRPSRTGFWPGVGTKMVYWLDPRWERVMDDGLDDPNGLEFISTERT